VWPPLLLCLLLFLIPWVGECEEYKAQQAGKVYRLGILSPTAPVRASERTSTAALVPAALREMGYVEGQNLVIARRFADGHLDRLPGLARQIVEFRPDVILAVGSNAPGAAKDASTTIPVVMIMSGDPVKLGYVANLARPGGNITGVVISETGPAGLADKRLQLLREAVPKATRVAILATDEASVKGQVQEAERAASSLGITLIAVNVVDRDYEAAFARIASERADALFVPSSAILNVDRKRIITLAAKRRLPAIYQWREHAAEGGLMAYGSNISALSRQMASYIDRILKGANPAELPLEQPTTYELTINLKAAKALGLTIPESLGLRADQVIE
jgi:putative ABC transport system substrate-binding protein